MKTIMLILMLAAVPAWADEDPFITWIKLNTMSTGETRDARHTHLQQHGFTAQGADEYIDAIQGMNAEVRVYEKRWNDSVCENAAQLSTDPEALAQEVERMRAGRSALLASLISQLANKLAEKDSSTLTHLLSDPSHGASVDQPEPGAFDIVDRIREGRVDPKRYVYARCNPPLPQE